MDRRFQRETWPLWGAYLVALTALLGSLYFSQIRHFTPCVLCWAQRIAMYPLVPILGFMLITRIRALAYLVFFGSLLGQGISVYHYLLQKTTLLTAADTCGGGVSCGITYIDWWGVVTIPLLAMIAFMLVTVGMLSFLAGPAAPRLEPAANDIPTVILLVAFTLLGILIWAGVFFEARGSRVVSLPPVASSPKVSSPSSQSDFNTSIHDGVNLFESNCKVCHGQNGEGITGLTPSLQTSERVRDLQAQQLADLIQRGVTKDDPLNQTGNLMPPSGGAELNDAELKALVAFLQSQVAP